MKKFLFSLVMVALVAFSCKKDEKPALELSKNGTIEVVSGASEQSITVKTNQKTWTAKSDANWVEVAQNGEILKLNIKENTTIEARKANITVTAGSLMETFVINQAAANAVFDIAPKTIDATKEAGSYTININTNIPNWTFKSEVKWIEASQAGNVLTVKVEENNVPEERSAEIEITAGKEKAIVTVKQAAANLIFEVNPTSIEAAYEANTYTVTVNTNVVEWSVKSNSDWVVASKSGDKVTLEVAANTTPSERSAEIEIIAGTSNAKVTVKQAAVPFLNVTDKLEVDGAAGTHTIDVNTNTTWEVSCDQSWATVTKKDDKTISVVVTENTSDASREAKITVKYLNESKVITFVQKISLGKYFPYLEPNLTVAEAKAFEEGRGGNFNADQQRWYPDEFRWDFNSGSFRYLTYYFPNKGNGPLTKIEQNFSNTEEHRGRLETYGFTKIDSDNYIKKVTGKVDGKPYTIKAYIPSQWWVVYTFEPVE